MSNTASLKKEYVERIAPELKSQFQYSSTMQIPMLKKIVINQGLGMARNTGLEHATGEFVCFVDSDDWIEPNALGSSWSQYLIPSNLARLVETSAGVRI